MKFGRQFFDKIELPALRSHRNLVPNFVFPFPVKTVSFSWEKLFSEKGEGSLESATNRCALHGCYSNWFRRRNGERVLSNNRHILLPWASQMGNLSSSTPPSLAQLLMEFQISGNVLKHFPSSCHCRFNDISDCFELTKYFRFESTWRLMDIHMISLHPSNEYSLNYLMSFNEIFWLKFIRALELRSSHPNKTKFTAFAFQFDWTSEIGPAAGNWIAERSRPKEFFFFFSRPERMIIFPVQFWTGPAIVPHHFVLRWTTERKFRLNSMFFFFLGQSIV